MMEDNVWTLPVADVLSTYCLCDLYGDLAFSHTNSNSLNSTRFVYGDAIKHKLLWLLSFKIASFTEKIDHLSQSPWVQVGIDWILEINKFVN